MTLINELLENVHRTPPAHEARKLLIEQYILYGWLDAAEEHAQEILKTKPYDTEALAFLNNLQEMKSAEDRALKERQRKANQLLGSAKGHPPKWNSNDEWNGKALGVSTGSWRPSVFSTTSPDTSLQELEKGYMAVLEKARVHQHIWERVQTLKGMRLLDSVSRVTLAQGKTSSLLRLRSLGNVRDLARNLAVSTGRNDSDYLEIIIEDLQRAVQYFKDTEEPSHDSPFTTDNDRFRERLVQHVQRLKTNLPSNLLATADTALMHVEHEVLQQEYHAKETMYGDAIADIPRKNFWVTEDGYAWDMEELAQAITSNGGVMRNPLSKEMFTPADITAIVQHPQGRHLQALQVKQTELKCGVRSHSVQALAALARILIEDMTEDQQPSRRAVEGFAAYLATLPSHEQMSIDELKVPAKDSHTGMEFDMTIGDAVRDAIANKVCFHKIGDLLQQAAQYLEK